MTHNNNTIISPNWPSFSRIWKIVAIILFILLVLLWLIGASPWSKDGGACAVKPPAPVTKNLVDTLGPYISLNCSSEVHIEEGSSYKDIGATAMDNIDGQSEVVVTGEVDYTKPGKYVLTYTATDKAGNISSTTKTVIVDAKKKSDGLPTAAKLYFENDSAEYPADTQLSLAAVIAYLKRNPGSHAVISGFGSATGSLEHNMELSKQRAKSVSRLLQESGVSADRIILEKPVEVTGTGSEEEARRVEVSVR